MFKLFSLCDIQYSLMSVCFGESEHTQGKIFGKHLGRQYQFNTDRLINILYCGDVMDITFHTYTNCVKLYETAKLSIIKKRKIHVHTNCIGIFSWSFSLTKLDRRDCWPDLQLSNRLNCIATVQQCSVMSCIEIAKSHLSTCLVYSIPFVDLQIVG